MKHFLLPITFLFTVNCFAQSPALVKLMESANAKFKIKSYKLALTDYEAAIKLVQPDVDKLTATKSQITSANAYLLEPYVKKANCDFYLSNTPALQKDYETIIKLDSANAEAKAIKGYLTHKDGKKAEGCAAMKANSANSLIAKKGFEDCFCWSEGVNEAKAAKSANMLKKFDEALTHINNAIAIMPDSAYVYAERANTFNGKGNTKAAISDLTKAITMKPNNYKFWHQRGMIFFNLNKHDSAFADLSKCIELNQTIFDAYYTRAIVCEKLQQWNSAIYDYKHAVTLNQEKKGELYFALATIYKEQLENIPEACTYYTASFQAGYEEAAEMSKMCADPKFKKKYKIK